MTDQLVTGQLVTDQLVSEQLVDERPSAEPAAPDESTGPVAPPRGGGPTLARYVLVSLLLAGLLVAGFVAFLLGGSTLSEQRAQRNMAKTFQHSLGQAIAPIGPTTPGQPVAVLQIPRIGEDNLVVVEGTDARRLATGPGHRRDTPLPGQAGISVIYGRRTLFGAPFGDLGRLRVGDRITAVTGLGRVHYVVTSFGTGARPAQSSSPNRLVLTTGDSAWEPDSTISVSADLVGNPLAAPGVLPQLAPDERAMSGSADTSLLPLMLWGQLLLVLAVITPFALHWWSPWPVYVCVAPCVLAVLWNVYENAAMLLPNLM